jgi:transposase
VGKIKTLNLTEGRKIELEKGCRKGKSHAFRNRCHLVLLKEQGRTSNEVAAIVNMCEMSVINWMERYEQEGIG